ncbi:uncharacterized protein [Argopecten irradians]|uniref:uncharacterized protein n=1 Tax=Argopecten irradians TaxID=31199 RepID=UPI003711C4CC
MASFTRNVMTDMDDLPTSILTDSHDTTIDTDDLPTSVLTDSHDTTTDTDDLHTPDVLGTALSLRKLLIQHDRSLQQINLLDSYIARLTRQALVYLGQGRKGQALRILTHRSVANGIKFQYRVYRLYKWQQVQQIVKDIMHTLGQEALTIPNLPDFTSLSDLEVDQDKGISHTLTVIHSNYYRDN